MHFGPEVGYLSLVPRADVHQIGVDPVRHLGLGPNQLVPVVDEGPEVGKHLNPVGRRQHLSARHDPSDCHRVDHV